MVGQRAVRIAKAKAGLFVVRNPKGTADTRLLHRALQCRSLVPVGVEMPRLKLVKAVVDAGSSTDWAAMQPSRAS
jgi:hypothetical protein